MKGVALNIWNDDIPMNASFCRRTKHDTRSPEILSAQVDEVDRMIDYKGRKTTTLHALQQQVGGGGVV